MNSYSGNKTEDAVKRAIILSVDATTAFCSTKKIEKLENNYIIYPHVDKGSKLTRLQQQITKSSNSGFPVEVAESSKF